MSRNRFARAATVAATFAVAGMMLSGCVAGEDAPAATAAEGEATGKFAGQTLEIDFATYNPLSLIIKEQGWLEKSGLDVTWVQSAGSNKANEALRAGAIDVGSTAGSAALLARANGATIRTIEIYSQPEWSAIVVPADSELSSVEDLRGTSIAATRGTDPYFFLLQTLNEAGIKPSEVTVQNVQHADGWTALQAGSVDAWAGLDPIMAGAEQEGARLLYRNVDFNSYGFLNATEEFLANQPEVAQFVVDTYERARAWATANPEETAEILADVAGLSPEVATVVIEQRSNLDVSGIPGQAQLDVLAAIGPVFVELGDVTDQVKVDTALTELLDPSLAENADPARSEKIAP